MDIKRVGVIIADDMEYAPVIELSQRYGSEQGSLLGRRCDRFVLRENDRELHVLTVYCGVGKVNAAAATATVIADGVDYVVNTGLSGGISHVGRGMITLPDRLLEYDFDLTVLGYDFAEKPLQDYIYDADRDLTAVFADICPHAKIGTMVTGDRFVSDSTLKAQLIEHFGAVSCDMESAAIASVCHSAGVPFTAVRRVSDDAGESATESYTDMNDRAESTLVDIVFDGLRAMLRDSKLF